MSRASDLSARRLSVRELSRRAFLAGAAGGLAGCAVGAVKETDPLPAEAADGAATAPVRWRVPAEHVPHRRTWMAWPSSSAIWGSWLPRIQGDIALVARTIARYEPVVMLADGLGAARKAQQRCGPDVRVIDTVPVDDCWMRDTGPVFRLGRAGALGAVGLGFNGWGGKQEHGKDKAVARQVARRARATFRRAGIVGEGGAVEADGHGTLLATESSLVNDNRNPGMTRQQVEDALLVAYGAKKMIWVPGIRGRDITDDHIDATSRFVRPGVVMVQVPPSYRRDIWARDAREQRRILSKATDAHGRTLEVVEMAGPNHLRPKDPQTLDSYVNFALTNGAVITAQFGDRKTDDACRATLAEAFPGREVVQLNVDWLHRGGGGIHCVTQQQPTS